jgi:hypothetical protein
LCRGILGVLVGKGQGIVVNEPFRLPATLQDLLDSCETGCVVDCCDMQAFEFTEENFRAWLAAHPDRKGDVLRELEEVLRAISGWTRVWVDSGKISFNWTRDRAQKLFTDAKDVLEGIR